MLTNALTDRIHFLKLVAYSFATAVSELTRGSSTGAGGKGHVKSASVSSPGPSAADSNNGAQQSDPLGARYIVVVSPQPPFLPASHRHLMSFNRINS